MMQCRYKDQKRHVFPHILQQVHLLHLTFLLLRLNLKIPQTVSTRHITFERPPNPLDRAEPPKRTTADDDEDSVIWV